jgi:hypothetical protein
MYSFSSSLTLLPDLELSDLQAEAKASERADDLAFLAAWDVRVKELKEEEEAERRERLEAARKLQVRAMWNWLYHTGYRCLVGLVASRLQVRVMWTLQYHRRELSPPSMHLPTGNKVNHHSLLGSVCAFHHACDQDLSDMLLDVRCAMLAGVPAASSPAQDGLKDHTTSGGATRCSADPEQLTSGWQLAPLWKCIQMT